MMFEKYIWAICNECEGEGTTGHPAFANGFTSSEWEELDHEDRQNYLDGRYDIRCSSCNGRGSVKIPDIGSMSFAEKRRLVERRREMRTDQELQRDAAAERATGA